MTQDKGQERVASTSSIRKKLKSTYPNFGDRSPWWTSKILGYAKDDPNKIMSGLDLGNFKGTGDDWMTDIYNLMSIATRPPILSNLYNAPYLDRGRKSIAIAGRSPIYEHPAIMQRIIMSILWAAEKTGKIAMPEKMRVEIGEDQRSVWISWNE